MYFHFAIPVAKRIPGGEVLVVGELWCELCTVDIILLPQVHDDVVNV